MGSGATSLRHARPGDGRSKEALRELSRQVSTGSCRSASPGECSGQMEEDVQQAATIKIDQGNMQPFSRVRVVELQAQVSWNGQTGTTLCYHTQIGRWKVLMSDGSLKNLKPQNLELMGEVHTQDLHTIPGIDPPPSPCKQEATTTRQPQELLQLLEGFGCDGTGCMARQMLLQVLQVVLPTAPVMSLEAAISASGADMKDSVNVRAFLQHLYGEHTKTSWSEEQPDFSGTGQRNVNPCCAELGASVSTGDAVARSDVAVRAVLYEDGSEYRGELTCDKKRHGYGVWNTSIGTYSGQFANDLQHGYGVQGWCDGRHYEGHFEKGRYHGHGKMLWTTEAGEFVYEGEYKDGVKDGHGVFRWADGRSYDGEWKHGQRHGLAKYTSKDSAMRVGIWKEDKFQNWVVPEDIA